MAILTHGSDLTLAPTIRQLVEHSGRTVRNAIAATANMGFSSVQLDATLSGIRPRELDSRARKDLQSLFVRQGTRIAGVDLFIPNSHFADAKQLDRAMSAALATIKLAADLGRLPVSIPLPIKKMSEDSKSTLVEAADGHGVTLAVHYEADLNAAAEWLMQVDLPVLKLAIDPAALLARGRDPFEIVQKYSHFIAVGRLSDLQSKSEDDDAAAGIRCPVGEGELAVDQYRIAMDLCQSRLGPIVLDLRGLSEPLPSARLAADVWSQATFEV